jgi:Tol biopolymer transport system component
MRPLTFDPASENIMPVWSPDAIRIVFASHREGKWRLYQKPADGTATEELLFETDQVVYPIGVVAG